VDFGGGLLAAIPGNDIFLANFSASGSHQWSKIIGSGYANGSALAVNSAGHPIVAGSFGLTVDFGAGPITSVGDHDIFLMEFAP
jgi:hypothetical protein